MHSIDDITRWVLPCRQAVLRLSTTCPTALVCTRTLAKAGRLDTFGLFPAPGFGLVSFAAKGLVKYVLKGRGCTLG